MLRVLTVKSINISNLTNQLKDIQNLTSPLTG
jgi:hypothetical protein